MLLSRSPNEPIETESTRSPGLRVLTTATSRPPVPEVVNESTSEDVSKTQFRPSVTRRRIWANSGPRWFIIWRLPAARTSSGTGVGPGIRRFTIGLHAKGWGWFYGQRSAGSGQPNWPLDSPRRGASNGATGQHRYVPAAGGPPCYPRRRDHDSPPQPPLRRFHR